MNNRTILIADDDINLVHLLRSTLEPLAGHIYRHTMQRPPWR